MIVQNGSPVWRVTHVIFASASPRILATAHNWTLSTMAANDYNLSSQQADERAFEARGLAE